MAKTEDNMKLFCYHNFRTFNIGELNHSGLDMHKREVQVEHSDYPTDTKFMVTQKAKSEEKEKIKHYQITLEIPSKNTIIKYNINFEDIECKDGSNFTRKVEVH